MMYLWKDNAMTIGVTLLLAQAVNVCFSRGQWLKRLPNAVAFGLALAFTTMVRHNAVLFTLPLLLAALLMLPQAARARCWCRPPCSPPASRWSGGRCINA